MILNNTTTTIMYTQDQMNIFLDRYALRDTQGSIIESRPEEMFDRVANAFADSDREREGFRRILDGFKFVPGGRILASGGTGTEAVAYNCYVIPLEPDAQHASGRDSRESIIDTVGRMVNIMSRGGGVGINWSTLRPRNAHLARINGTSSGPIGWMDVASKAVGEVIQGGSRRGAAMFMLNDWHPDILEFTNIKRDSTKVTNANVSVAISDAFMEAVKDDTDWNLAFPDTTDPDYNTKWDGDIGKWSLQHKVNIHQTVRARDLWHAICAGAHDNGEPGIVFLERYNDMSTGRDIERIVCVNPCGEQGLGEYSVCNLGSMNISQYISQGRFLEDEFANDVMFATDFLDNVIDKTHYMEDMPQTYEQQMKLRRIGLGIMGLADALVMMGMRYGSPEAVSFTAHLFKVMKYAALEASVELAKQKGPALGWNPDMLSRPFLLDIDPDLREKIKQHGLRNIFLLTQAPTGTTSLLAGVNSGIEPFFALEYERNDRMGKRMVRPKSYEDWINGLSLVDPTVTPPDYFVTASELSVEEHIAMQAAAQAYIDSSISKTVNAPNSHTVDDVDKLYMLCYDSGLKGISYFREGCNRGTVLSRPKEQEQIENTITSASPYVRPDKVYGPTIRKRTKYGNAFITVNYAEDNGPIEVFINVGRASSDISEWAESVGRLISLSLQNGVAITEISEQLTGVGGYGKMAPSLSSAIAEALQEGIIGHVPSEPIQMKVPERVPVSTSRVAELCAQCGNAAFIREEGCMKCMICGNSKC